LIPSHFLTHDRYSVFRVWPIANDSLVLYTVPGNLFFRFAVLHFITELFIALMQIVLALMSS